MLYAHALVAAPRLALGRFAPLGRVLGDPRLGMAGAFLSLRRVLPDRYPLDRDVERYIADEQRLGRMLDYAVIVPRLQRLYEWSAEELAEPRAARADPRRQPDLRVALRGAPRVALRADAVRRPRAGARHAPAGEDTRAGGLSGFDCATGQAKAWTATAVSMKSRKRDHFPSVTVITCTKSERISRPVGLGDELQPCRSSRPCRGR